MQPELDRVTIHLFKRLEELYQHRECLRDTQHYEHRQVNLRIGIVEKRLDAYCNKHYEFPWFRIYSYWRIHHKDKLIVLQ